MPLFAGDHEHARLLCTAERRNLCVLSVVGTLCNAFARAYAVNAQSRPSRPRFDIVRRRRRGSVEREASQPDIAYCRNYVDNNSNIMPENCTEHMHVNQ